MAKPIVGPWQIAWGSNPILDVSEISYNYDRATNDYETVDGRTYQTEGAITASVELTLLATDVDALRIVFPQYYVAKGEKLSTGETVKSDDGAIDIVAAKCDTSDTTYPLDVISCSGEVIRLVNAKTRLSAIDIADNSVRTVTVTFTGQPEQGAANLQILAAGEFSS